MKNGGKGLDRKEYMSDYYIRNKAKIAARKKAKYDADPELRRRIIEASKISRQRKSASRTVNGQLIRVYTVLIGGRTVSAYSVKKLAESLGKSIWWLNAQIMNGNIPVTPFCTPRGFRLYTQSMIDTVVDVLKDKCLTNRQAYDKIVENWSLGGIYEN